MRDVVRSDDDAVVAGFGQSALKVIARGTGFVADSEGVAFSEFADFLVEVRPVGGATIS